MGTDLNQNTDHAVAIMVACAACPLKLLALLTILGPAGAYVGSWVICKYHNRKVKHGSKEEARCKDCR